MVRVGVFFAARVIGMRALVPVRLFGSIMVMVPFGAHIAVTPLVVATRALQALFRYHKLHRTDSSVFTTQGTELPRADKQRASAYSTRQTIKAHTRKKSKHKL